MEDWALHVQSRQNCRARLASFFTDFHSAKRVVLHSKWLRIPELTLQSVIAFYVIVYQMILKLGCLQESKVTAHPLIDFSMAASNFKNCSSAENNCKWLNPALESLGYCKEHECNHFLVGEVAFQSGSSGVFITTSMTEVDEYACNATAREQGCEWSWATTAKRTVYVKSPESYMVKFRHRFSAAGFPSLSGENAQGLLVWTTEPDKPRRLHCDFPKCPFDSMYWKRKYPDACGTNSGADNQTCMSRPMGDYVSLAVLLDGANVSLDEHAWPESKATWREVGIPIMLDISFSNMMFWDYVQWPFGQTVQYTMRAEHVLFSHKDEYVKRELHMLSNGTRRTIYRRGVYLYTLIYHRSCSVMVT